MRQPIYLALKVLRWQISAPNYGEYTEAVFTLKKNESIDIDVCLQFTCAPHLSVLCDAYLTRDREERGAIN